MKARPRVAGVDSGKADPYARRLFELQTETWGAPLLNHEIYARRPALLKAVRGMWAALNADHILDDTLVALVNRRVARLNQCVF